MTGEIVKKVTENVTITAIARISMMLSMPTFGLVASLGVYWVKSEIKDEVNTLRLDTISRLIVLEIQQKSAEKLENKFAATEKAINDLAHVVAGLTATVANMVENRQEDLKRMGPR